MPDPRGRSDPQDAADPAGVGESDAVDIAQQREVTPLERRYRGWLRLLPVDYRRQWEDDMVDTFLAGALVDDDAEAREIAGYGTPPAAEVGSVLSLAVRLRLGTSERAARPLLWREAWRRVALIGLLVNTVWVTVSLPSVVWFEGWLPGASPPVDSAAPVPDHVSKFELVVGGWWHSYWSVAGLLTVAAFLALLHGRRGTAAALAVAGVLPGLVDSIRSGLFDGPAFTAAWLGAMTVHVLPVLAMVAFVGNTPAVHRRPWLWAWPTGVALLALLTVVAWTVHPDVLMDPTGFYCMALAVIGAAYLVRQARRHEPPEPAVTLTIAILATVVLLDRVATLSTFWAGGDSDPVTLRLHRSGLVEAAVVAAVALTFGVLATRAVRALPVAVER